MMEIIGGDEQPGEPSSARGDRRDEIGLGDGTAETGRGPTVGESRQLCVWPSQTLSVRGMWDRLRSLLGADEEKIRRVRRVRQRADLYRFDVSVDADSCQHILGVLRRAKHRQGWWVREHIHYFRRLRRVMGLNVPGGAAMGANGEIRLFKVATWNIHSVVSKRQELEMYLQSTGVKLLALQETYRTLESWPIHLKNYQVFESVAAGGVGRAAAQNRQSQNGLALVIHRSLVAYEVGGSSPYVIVVRVMIGQLEWHILNIYLPPRGSLSRMAAIAEVKRAVASVFARDLDARMMILGDWNMEKDKLSSMFRRWRQPLGCIPCNGNPSTYHSGRRWTSIDHIVVTANVQSMMRRVRVNRGWDLSDHWPLESVVRAYSSVQHVLQHGIAV
jgi:exonuclease III